MREEKKKNFGGDNFSVLKGEIKKKKKKKRKRRRRKIDKLLWSA